ncbi:hypothetical protein SY85_17020 [Flavisolibacter tropicus]|uniref:Uncharacterized protein n=1 Tax=Flavisolibacter tropicus TaxID=1492898 RepID=A0A172TY26_9BACT|nr:hypothetical protein SY85_17020 [Flavisolibacter tropicus]
MAFSHMVLFFRHSAQTLVRFSIGIADCSLIQDSHVQVTALTVAQVCLTVKVCSQILEPAIGTGHQEQG